MTSSELAILLNTIKDRVQLRAQGTELTDCTGVVETDQQTQRYYEWEVADFEDTLGIRLDSSEYTHHYSLTRFADQLESRAYLPAVYDSTRNEIHTYEVQ
jgi:hypothetical protein